MGPSRFLSMMPLTSYGNFGNLPREIRDMIWAEYFSVATPATLEQYLETTKSEPTLYVNEPDTGLLRASRALYQETQPFWKNRYEGTRLFQMATGLTQPLEMEKFLTLSAQSLPKPPPYMRSMHATWLSYSWLYNMRLLRTSRPGHLQRARIVFPSLQYFLKTDMSEMERSMELFAKLLGASSWRVRGRLNFFIEDANWPLPQPGENIWYERLHQGMTRRSLKRSRESQLQLKIIMQRLSDIISRFQKLVAIVSCTFGDNQSGRHNDKAGEIRHLVSALKNEMRDTGIIIEYTRPNDPRIMVRSP